MQEYYNYEIEDLVIDNSFIDWCLSTDLTVENKWTQLADSSTELNQKIRKARQIVLALKETESYSSFNAMEDEMWSKIDHEISTPKVETRSNRKLFYALSVAASICVLIFFGSKYVLDSPLSISSQNATDQEWVNIENTEGISTNIILPDNSLVILEPFSSLKYPTFFTNEQRTVFLKGEAFFDIERDTLRPFLVYANETITKVLGTSFTIKAYEGQETVEVDVKSGKVAVYAKVASNKRQKEKNIVLQTDEEIIVPLPNKKLEVTPNHRVVFDRKIELLTRKITQSPILIKKIETLSQYSFKDESVVKLFNAISQIYGVSLEFNEEELADCLITTKLENEPLFQVLEIVSTALNLNFQEVDASIIITGNGCQ